MALPVDLCLTQEMRRCFGNVCLGVRVAQVIQLRGNQSESRWRLGKISLKAGEFGVFGVLVSGI